MKISRTAAVAFAVVAGAGLASGAFAASAMTSKPMKMAAKPAAAPSTLYCQIGKTGTKVTVQVVNKGTKDVAAGTLFAYTIDGAKMKTPATYKLKWALGPKEWINLSKPMPAASVKGCTPTAA